MKKNTVGILLLSMSICLLVGCTVPGDTDKHWRPKFVKGVVLDSLTNQPIDSVKMSLGLKSDSSSLVFGAYTNRNGEYQIFVGWGTNSAGSVVVAQKINYEMQRKEFSTGSVDTAIVNFKLLPTKK